MRDGEDFISLFSYRNELEKYVLHMKLKKVKKNCKAWNLLSFTNYRDKAYNFIEVFLLKDELKFLKNMLRDGLWFPLISEVTSRLHTGKQHLLAVLFAHYTTCR